MRLLYNPRATPASGNLQSHRIISSAQPGSRVAVNLSGVDRGDIQRSDVVTRPGSCAYRSSVVVRYLPDAGRRSSTTQRSSSSAAPPVRAHVRLVGNRELLPVRKAGALRLAQPLPSTARPLHPALPSRRRRWRRGGARPHRWRRFKPEVIARFETLAAGTPEDLVLHASRAKQPSPPIWREPGLQAARLKPRLPRSRGGASCCPARGWPSRVAALTGRMQAELAAYHQRSPLRLGMPRGAAQPSGAER